MKNIWGIVGGALLFLVIVIVAFGRSGSKKTRRSYKRKKGSAKKASSRSKKRSVSKGARNTLRKMAGIREGKKYVNMTLKEKRSYNLAKARRARKRMAK